MSVPNPIYTVAFVAKKAGVHPNTIRRWADNGILPCKRTDKGVRYFPDIEATLKILEEYGYPIEVK
jgi:DNA-binding transcriptional MerR regulator